MVTLVVGCHRFDLVVESIHMGAALMAACVPQAHSPVVSPATDPVPGTGSMVVVGGLASGQTVVAGTRLPASLPVLSGHTGPLLPVTGWGTGSHSCPRSSDC